MLFITYGNLDTAFYKNKVVKNRGGKFGFILLSIKDFCSILLITSWLTQMFRGFLWIAPSVSGDVGDLDAGQTLSNSRHARTGAWMGQPSVQAPSSTSPIVPLLFIRIYRHVIRATEWSCHRTGWWMNAHSLIPLFCYLWIQVSSSNVIIWSFYLLYSTSNPAFTGLL